MSDFVAGEPEPLPPAVEVERFALLVCYGGTYWSTSGTLYESMEKLFDGLRSYNGAAAYRFVRLKLPVTQEAKP